MAIDRPVIFRVYWSVLVLKYSYMELICPECKNKIDLSVYPKLKTSDVIECALCGITLEVKAIENNEVKVEIVDEGK